MRPQLILLLGLLLAGCGTSGYVQSDIPGVAQAFAQMNAKNQVRTCPRGTTDVKVDASASHATTSVGLKRSRFEHDIVCD